MAQTIGPWPIVVTRDRAGALHAFHNSCRHRGAQVCQNGKGAAARLVCPYHRWTYELTGALAQATRMPADFRGGDHGLRPHSRRRPSAACSTSAWPTIRRPSRPFAPPYGPLHRAARAGGRQARARERPGRKRPTGSWPWRTPASATTAPRRHPELAQSFPVGASAHFDYGEDRAAGGLRTRAWPRPACRSGRWKATGGRPSASPSTRASSP